MRGRLIVTLLVVVAARPAAAAELFRYLAFGDSITEGIGIPIEGGRCREPVPLGSSGQTGAECGYPPRLERLLGCVGGRCLIENEGKGSEKTHQGMSRINGTLRLAPWDVVILMEGTNDVFREISNSDIRFNMTEMARKAEAAGADPVLASIIWLSPDGKWGKSKDATVAALREALRSSASGSGWYFADAWSELCPAGTTDRHGHGQPACFDTHYLKGKDPVGHPNASGFQMLAERFRDTLLRTGVPGAAQPLGAGEFCDERPVVDWAEERPLRATGYVLIVHDEKGAEVYRARGSRRDFCAGTGRCSLTLPQLGPGEYTWRVLGRNPAGFGAESPLGRFVVVDEPPGSPEALGPGSGAEITDPTPTYSWTAVPGGTRYELEIDGGETAAFEASGICAGGICSIEPGRPFLEPGSHSFRARAANCIGPGDFSARSDFEVVACDETRGVRRSATRLVVDSNGRARGELPLEVALSQRTPSDLGSETGLQCAISLINQGEPVEARGSVELELRASGRDAGGAKAVAGRSLARKVERGEVVFTAEELRGLLTEIELGGLQEAVADSVGLAFAGQGRNRVERAALDCVASSVSTSASTAEALVATAAAGETALAATGLCYDGRRPRSRIVLDAAVPAGELAAADGLRCAVELEQVGNEKPAKGSLRLVVSGTDLSSDPPSAARSVLQRKLAKGVGVFDRPDLDKLVRKFERRYPEAALELLTVEYKGAGGLGIDQAAILCQTVPAVATAP